MNAFLLLYLSMTGILMLLATLGNPTIFIFLIQKGCEFIAVLQIEQTHKYPRQSIKAQDYEKLFSSN